MSNDLPVTNTPPEKSSAPWMSIFVVVGLVLAWVLVVVFKPSHDPDKNSLPSSVGGQDQSVYAPPVHQPYVEEDSSMGAVVDKRSHANIREAKAILPDGTIVYGGPDSEEIAESEARVLARRLMVKRAQNARRRSADVDPGAAQARMKPVRIVDIDPEALDEMRESGQLDRMLDEQYERMIKKLNKGYGPEGGPTREQIEQIRLDGVLEF